ncbi:MAG: RNA polymerase sigma factor region1.1 domain-containing protein [Acidobacteriota bacterium]
MAAMKEKDIEDALLELGVKRGVLFFEELYDFFPADYFPLEEMNRFLMLLDDLGVKVVEGDGEGRQKTRHKHRAA